MPIYTLTLIDKHTKINLSVFKTVIVLKTVEIRALKNGKKMGGGGIGEKQKTVSSGNVRLIKSEYFIKIIYPDCSQEGVPPRS